MLDELGEEVVVAVDVLVKAVDEDDLGDNRTRRLGTALAGSITCENGQRKGRQTVHVLV